MACPHNTTNQAKLQKTWPDGGGAKFSGGRGNKSSAAALTSGRNGVSKRVRVSHDQAWRACRLKPTCVKIILGLNVDEAANRIIAADISGLIALGRNARREVFDAERLRPNIGAEDSLCAAGIAEISACFGQNRSNAQEPEGS